MNRHRSNWNPNKKTILESCIRSTTTEYRRVFRSCVILMAAEGLGTNAIARQLEVRPATITKWRLRFARLGLAGLEEAPRPGKKRVILRMMRSAYCRCWMNHRHRDMPTGLDACCPGPCLFQPTLCGKSCVIMVSGSEEAELVYQH